MKIDNVVSNGQLHSIENHPHEQHRSRSEGENEIGLTINYQDPDAPPENIIEKMSEGEKSLISTLLRPFDMCFHLCNDARQIIAKNYQSRINETLGAFEKTIEDVQLELRGILECEEFNNLSRLYMTCIEYKEMLDKLSLLYEKEKIKVDNLQTQNSDCNNNKKKDITPEYSEAQLKQMSDFEVLGNKFNDKKRLYELSRIEINSAISNLNPSSLTKSLLYIMKEGAHLRTPLLLEQLALTTSVPEIPGAYSKAGIQIQIVLPSKGVIKKLFNSKPIENIFIQPFFHLEEGVGTSMDITKNVELPINIKLAATALRVNHFGLNIPVNRSIEGWHCEKAHYVIELVNRLETAVNVSGDKLSTPLDLQLKVGADTVRQFVFSCNKSGTTRFMVQLALRAAGAMATGYSALALGATASTVKACCIAGADVTGVFCEMIKVIEPDYIVDIIEPLTLGIDFSVNTNIEVPYLGTLNYLSMQRLNSGFVVEHDIKKHNPVATQQALDTTLDSNPMNGMEMRHRKSSVVNKGAFFPLSDVTTV